MSQDDEKKIERHDGEKTPVNAEVLKVVELCAEQGWRANFYFHDGSSLEQAFITGTDFENLYIRAERMAERHLKPHLIHLPDLKNVEPDWTSK